MGRRRIASLPHDTSLVYVTGTNADGGTPAIACASSSLRSNASTEPMEKRKRSTPACDSDGDATAPPPPPAPPPNAPPGAASAPVCISCGGEAAPVNEGRTYTFAVVLLDTSTRVTARRSNSPVLNSWKLVTRRGSEGGSAGWARRRAPDFLHRVGAADKQRRHRQHAQHAGDQRLLARGGGVGGRRFGFRCEVARSSSAAWRRSGVVWWHARSAGPCLFLGLKPSKPGRRA